MFPVFTLFVVCLAIATAHEYGRPLNHLPSVSRSLINFGKMDISIHFNGMPESPKKAESKTSQQNYYSQETNGCPCTRNSNKGFPPMANPFDIVSRILKNNDLFGNKMATSPQCCEGHEETIYFELTPNNINLNPLNNIKQGRSPSFLFDNIIPRRPSTTRPKAVEIFLFPKRKDMMTVEYLKERPRKTMSEGDALIPGNKALKPDFKVAFPSSSVKKDLSLKPDKREGLKEELQRMRTETTKNNVV